MVLIVGMRIGGLLLRCFGVCLAPVIQRINALALLTLSVLVHFGFWVLVSDQILDQRTSPHKTLNNTVQG